eukprot:Sspe_Gene.40336::Locus_19472_Transcript_1_1_Confidence_1.000_Length_3708::g.40336::m.40336/K00889/PIP5K; 1-phosphatidylinositol-4-phosphate 5-kinase
MAHPQNGWRHAAKGKRSTAATYPIPMYSSSAQADISPMDLVMGMVHAIRSTLPMCPPSPEEQDSATVRPTNWSNMQGTAAPIFDEQLPTTDRLTCTCTFDLPTQRELKVQTTAPTIFMRMVTWSGVTAEEFLEEWCASLESAEEQASKGKSSSTFVYSSTRRFLIKTIKEEEHAALRHLLPSYYVHMLKNPNSLLNAHLGLFSVFRHKRGERKYFTVVPNILPTNPSLKLSCVYDLKGSTHKRAASEAERNCSLPVLKDNDFTEEGGKFQIGAVELRALTQQLARDCAWLESNNLMDYSLLVGKVQVQGGPAEIANLRAAFHSSDLSAGPKAMASRGMHVLHSVTTGTIYCMGIIDILQDYNFKKQVAHTVKTTLGGATDKAVSTVPANVYSDRFQHFMKNCFVKQRDVQWNFFLDPRQALAERSTLHRDDVIAVGDVVGRTHKETLTLDLLGPHVKSICVVTEVKRPATANLDTSDSDVQLAPHRNTSDRYSPVPGRYHSAVLPRPLSPTSLDVGDHSPFPSPSSSTRSPIQSGHLGDLRLLGGNARAAGLGRPASASQPHLSPPSARPPDSSFFLYTCSSGASIPVNVAGPVSAGDFLVPSGRNDGTAVAVPPTCLMSPYVIGIVESVPPIDHLPNADATKFTVVQAVVGEVYVCEPPVGWEVLELVQNSPCKAAPGLVQAQWVEVEEEACRSLTRSLMLSATEVSLVSLCGEWVAVDWMNGIIIKNATSIPIRPTAGPAVVQGAVARELHTKRCRLTAQIDRHASHMPDHVLVLQKRASMGSATSSYTAVSSPVPSMARHDSQASDLDEESLVSEVNKTIRNAENSFGGWLRGWFVQGLLPRLRGQRSAAILPKARATSTSSITKLFGSKVKGQFRQVLSYLPVNDAFRCARVSKQWYKQWLAPELWQFYLSEYHVELGPDTVPSPAVMKAHYDTPKRRIQFSIGERWEEIHGLADPDLFYYRRIALRLATELDRYDLVFRKHLLPHRTMTHMAFFRRHTREGVSTTDPSHTWEMDRAVQVFWPELQPQWLRTNLTVRFEPYFGAENEGRPTPITFPIQRDLRMRVMQWLDTTSYVKATWEGPYLLVRFHNRPTVEQVLKEYERGGGRDLGFIAKRYGTMQLWRRVVSWSEAKKRILEAYPDSRVESTIRPLNPHPTPMPPPAAKLYKQLAEEAGTVTEGLMASLERLLFPRGVGHSVVRPVERRKVPSADTATSP